ncbi:MAG TPA: potassium channel family protein [Pyrinomonadaceae bacterium]|nr:potassium channel family protein [Pyrinomonadaceae bacterium]
MLKELVVAFGIVSVCLVLHVASIVFIADWMLDQREKRKDHMGMLGYMALLIAAFSAIIVLHMIEIGIWAVLYYGESLFADFETSLYFSTTSYTTIGFGDVVLPRAWRMLGGIEGVTGVLLCGLSTAFVFAIVNALFQMRLQRRTNSS